MDRELLQRLGVTAVSAMILGASAFLLPKNSLVFFVANVLLLALILLFVGRALLLRTFAITVIVLFAASELLRS